MEDKYSAAKELITGVLFGVMLIVAIYIWSFVLP